MKTKTALENAQHLATAFCRAIQDVTERVEVAGSIRRCSKYVGDIEIVTIPKFKQDLFGQAGENLLEIRLQAFLDEGRFTDRTKNGPKYKQFTINGCRVQLDLFITTPACWPVIMAVRTGPADFTKQMVTQRHKGGLLQNGYHVSQGRLYHQNQPVDLRDEKHLFEYVEGGWVPPGDRGLKC